jgi:hypothetical protein
MYVCYQCPITLDECACSKGLTIGLHAVSTTLATPIDRRSIGSSATGSSASLLQPKGRGCGGRSQGAVGQSYFISRLFAHTEIDAARCCSNVMMSKLGVVVADLMSKVLGPDFVECLEDALGTSMETIHVPKLKLSKTLWR